MSTLTGDIAAVLRSLPLFGDAGDADILRLAESCLVSRYEKDGDVFFQGDPADRVWIVMSGRVKIVFQDANGREVIIEMIETGEPFGGAVLFFPKHPATARAATDCALVSLPTADYANFLAAHGKVALKLIRIFGQRHFAILQTRTLIGERVERRLAHILLKLADRTGKPTPEGTLITLSLSRQDLADMSGTTLETAIRTMSRFTQDGVVRTERGGFVLLLDRARIEALANAG